MEIREVKITRILNPTSIDLGEYVINPYKGCAYSCLYCYSRFSKVNLKEQRSWGAYVDARINAPALLEKEIKAKRPKRVLLGSTTECFQPLEKDLNLTGRILDILNRNRVYYSILTRSPDILDHEQALKQGFCESIYFTINRYDSSLKQLIEPKSPSFDSRVNTINSLLDKNIPVIPYFSPVLPYVSRYKDICGLFPKADRIDFEGLNFNLGNISEIIDAVENISPALAKAYKRMRSYKDSYEEVWTSVKRDLIKESIKYKKNHKIYIHGRKAYFENKYTQ